ncbi:ExeA family protein [Teredinibacter franksiae]|jgi:Type II secretory pathway, component ExeA (predicted ATPase)|uniref:ExeA family protein n=1 Tax=Teredinibacter franksiae TaxID=2761453 RepID=UPI001625C26B|nr:AAA family ATPase [Teredinibacter franksiae]
MYHQHFNLDEHPFSLTPDTQFFLNQQSHREALNTMLVALQHCEGFIKIVGEVGTGKTLLCRILLSRLRTHFVTAYIPNPYLSPEELKAFIAQEIGADYNPQMQAHILLSSIYRKLMQLAHHGKQVVLVVDEAQAMPRETIESLRLLTNLETEKRKLLQVVMLGQPELDTLLSRPDLRQLKQRIIFSEYLRPFSREGVADYIRHRLDSAGGDKHLFSPWALWLLGIGSGGIPRLINILAHKALISAYGKGLTRVGVTQVAAAIADTSETRITGKFVAWHCRWSKLAGGV